MRVYLTGARSSDRLTRQSDRHFAAGSHPKGMVIDVDPNRQLQSLTGVGAAFTDSSMWLLSKLSYAQRQKALRRIFGHQHGGIGLSVMRLPMGASDFTASGMYSYDDVAAADRDPSLAHFSIDHDRAYILPILREAVRINPSLRLIASPWSPPGWMKTNESMLAYSASGEVARLRRGAYGALARYFVRFLDAYRSGGIPIWAVTPQNEPDHIGIEYPGLGLPPADQVTLITRYLRPALRAAKTQVRLYGYDTNWYGSGLLPLIGSKPARRALDGLAFHCYWGTASQMSAIHRMYPALDLIEDECSAPALSAVDVTIRSLTHGASVVLTWNLALDPTGGPKIGFGCPSCTGLVTVDPASRDVRYSHDFWELAHVSAFVARGARRIRAYARGHPTGCDVSRRCDAEWVAFRNPDGRLVFVAANCSARPARFSLRRPDRSTLSYALPAASSTEPSVVTMVWR